LDRLVAGGQDLDPAYEAVTQFRAKMLAGAHSFVGEKRLRPQVVADLSVQALINESLHRNDANPEEMMIALTHGLGMIVGQQPDMLATTGEIAARILRFATQVRESLAKIEAPEGQ
jgi:hypothetical protein